MGYALGWQALSCRDLVEAARRLLARTSSNAAAATVDAGTSIVLPVAGMAVPALFLAGEQIPQRGRHRRLIHTVINCILRGTGGTLQAASSAAGSEVDRWHFGQDLLI